MVINFSPHPNPASLFIYSPTHNTNSFLTHTCKKSALIGLFYYFDCFGLFLSFFVPYFVFFSCFPLCLCVFLVLLHDQAVMIEVTVAQAEIARLLEQLRLTDRYLSFLSLFLSLCSVCNFLFSFLSSQQACDRDACLFW